MKKLTVLVPCYNEQECLGRTYNELMSMTNDLRTFTEEGLLKEKYDYEIIFVNDGSSDLTYELLKGFASSNPKVKVVSFLGNCGHQYAVKIGLKSATGDVVCVIDADLQDPPELIPRMLAHWEQGAVCVYGKRTSREGETAFKLKTADLFYKFINFMADDVEIRQQVGDFGLYDRSLVERMNQLPDEDRFLRGDWASLKGKQVAFEYDRKKRFAGETHYPLKKMIKLALDGIFAFSNKPIKIIGLAGILSLVLSFLFLLGAVISAVFSRGAIYWFILFCMGFFSGAILISLYVVGDYVHRCYKRLEKRGPVVEKHNIE